MNTRKFKLKEIPETLIMDEYEKTINENIVTIAILRRHPMYDCLVLVKRHSHCLNGFILEFPNGEKIDQTNCKLKVSFLDGDDPMNHNLNVISNGKGEVVHVPVNGLIDRLENYEKMGIAVDSRVFAFAMGLKTSEKMIAYDSIREPQETPI